MSKLPFVAYVETLLGAACRTLGVPVLYKGKEGREALPGLAADCHSHETAFCLKVKKNPDRYKKCQEFYAAELSRALAGKPGCVTCHAGAVQSCVPILKEGRYEGALLAGPIAIPSEKKSDGKTSKGLLWNTQKQKDLLTILSLIASQVTGTSALLLRRDKNGSLHHPGLLLAVEYINGHFHEDLSAAQAARAGSLSVSRLLHLFSKNTGQTFSAYLMGKRMERARQLLAFGDLPVGAVADACGFQYQSYFGKIFKRTMGVSALAFRRKHRKEWSP